MEELNKSLGERRREINNLQKKGEARYEIRLQESLKEVRSKVLYDNLGDP